MMIHRYWCAHCRAITPIRNQEPPDLVAALGAIACVKCSTPAVYLESVSAPADDPSDTSDPTAAHPRKPPSRQEWYDAGYAAGTYEPRFASPEWLPCWDDPSYVPTRIRVKQDGTLEPVTDDDTVSAPPVAPLGKAGMQSGESYDASNERDFSRPSYPSCDPDDVPGD